MKKRLQVFFSGTVQGVGFRYTAERIAQNFDITGYVRNLPDGRVEVVAEGEEPVLQGFLKALGESHMTSFIRKTEPHWSGAEGHFHKFGITT